MLSPAELGGLRRLGHRVDVEVEVDVNVEVEVEVVVDANETRKHVAAALWRL